MSETNDFLEHMEHAAHSTHGGGDHKTLGRFVGISMAVLGVLLALCSAMVGGHRTELIASMVDKTNVEMKYQTINTKFRMLVSQLQQLHSLCPEPKLYKKLDAEVVALAKTAKTPDVATIMRVIRLESAKNLNSEIPTHEDLLHFTSSIEKLEKEREAAAEWSEAYEPAIRTHSEAAERYEYGQLCAEVGIVTASIALLFLSRWVWAISLCLGLACLFFIGSTHSVASVSLHKAEHEIEECREKFVHLNSEQSAAVEDKQLLKSVAEDELPVIMQ